MNIDRRLAERVGQSNNGIFNVLKKKLFCNKHNVSPTI